MAYRTLTSLMKLVTQIPKIEPIDPMYRIALSSYAGDDYKKLYRTMQEKNLNKVTLHNDMEKNIIVSLNYFPKNYISYSKVPQHINVLDGKITAKFNNNRINIYNGAISIEKEHHLVNCTEHPSIFLSLHSAPTVVNTPLL